MNTETGGQTSLGVVSITDGTTRIDIPEFMDDYVLYLGNPYALSDRTTDDK